MSSSWKIVLTSLGHFFFSELVISKSSLDYVAGDTSRWEPLASLSLAEDHQVASIPRALESGGSSVVLYAFH